MYELLAVYMYFIASIRNEIKLTIPFNVAHATKKLHNYIFGVGASPRVLGQA